MTQQLDRQDDLGGDACTLGVEHVGGIDTCDVTFSPGVTLLTGRNATNRTSLLRALAGVLGGDAATLKSDADEGRVELAVGDETYTREYVRQGDAVRSSGEPYTDRATLVDLFVAVLEDNEARRAVERGDDLREVIMRPVDTDAIERRIRELVEEREAVRSDLRHSRERREELPALEARREDLADDLAAVEDELERLRAEAADAEAAFEGADAPVDELDRARRERREVGDRLDVVVAELDALGEELDELREERASLPAHDPADRDELARELESVREQKRRLDEVVASLTAVVEFNEDVLGGETLPPGAAPGADEPSNELAPEPDQAVACWTCGSQVQRGDVADRLDDLRAVADEKREERADLADRATELEEERTHVERVLERRRELDDDIEATEAKLAEREEPLEELEATAAGLDERIADLEDEVAAADDVGDQDLLETYQAISERRYEAHRLERELSDVEDDIADVEATPEPAELDARLEALSNELDNERRRVDQLEANAVEAFNDHMADVLEVLGYENLERVWLERKQEAGGDDPGAGFDLHVVRESGRGTVYEDVVAHLSESEREVVGLVVALAGYLVHDVAEQVPFMLLDSLEAVDAARIEQVVEYFAEHVPYLVVALLPEDARALPDDYERVTADALAG